MGEIHWPVSWVFLPGEEERFSEYDLNEVSFPVPASSDFPAAAHAARRVLNARRLERLSRTAGVSILAFFLGTLVGFFLLRSLPLGVIGLGLSLVAVGVFVATSVIARRTPASTLGVVDWDVFHLLGRAAPGKARLGFQLASGVVRDSSGTALGLAELVAALENGDVSAVSDVEAVRRTVQAGVAALSTRVSEVSAGSADVRGVAAGVLVWAAEDYVAVSQADAERAGVGDTVSALNDVVRAAGEFVRNGAGDVVVALERIPPAQ